MTVLWSGQNIFPQLHSSLMLLVCLCVCFVSVHVSSVFLASNMISLAQIHGVYLENQLWDWRYHSLLLTTWPQFTDKAALTPLLSQNISWCAILTWANKQPPKTPLQPFVLKSFRTLTGSLVSYTLLNVYIIWLWGRENCVFLCELRCIPIRVLMHYSTVL